MLHFVMCYMKQNESRKQTLESAQYELEISFKDFVSRRCRRGVLKLPNFSKKLPL